MTYGRLRADCLYIRISSGPNAGYQVWEAFTFIYHMAASMTRSNNSSTIVHATAVKQLECGPIPNVIAALSNIGGALCSMRQSLADAHYYTAVQ